MKTAISVGLHCLNVNYALSIQSGGIHIQKYRNKTNVVLKLENESLILCHMAIGRRPLFAALRHDGLIAPLVVDGAKVKLRKDDDLWQRLGDIFSPKEC